MSGTASLAAPHAPVIPRQEAAAAHKSRPDAQAVAVARLAMNQAQGRVDADRRVHSPGCVAVDQKGVDKASAELAQAQAAQVQAAQVQAAQSATPAGSQAVSITV